MSEGEQEEARSKALARESEWVKASPRARQAKSKARISAYEELLAKAQEARQGPAQIVIPAGPRLGSVGRQCDRYRQGLWRPTPVRASRFQASAGRYCGRDRSNGAGKTTLFPHHDREQEKPDSGTMRVATRS